MPPLRGVSNALSRWVPEVDVVQVNDASWDGLLVAAAEAARRYGKPLVVCPLMHLGSAWVRAHYQMAHQVEVYQKASAVLALSQREAEAYRALGVSPERVHTIRMGIDDALTARPEAPNSAGFRREHRLRGYVVAFIGTNSYDKGAFTLLQAVAQLALEGLNVDLVCAGPQDAALKTYLKRQSANTQGILRDHLHILGVVDEVTKHRLLAACDVLALPSQVDTFGIVFLEAWKHGKPVIGADAGGIPDLVRHEENGLIVPFDDVPALAAAVRRLLQEPDLASRLGRAGQLMVHGYTWDQTYRTLLEVYDRVLAGVP
jgi:glycosyltransferase involved in cell wall biosynthesis